MRVIAFLLCLVVVCCVLAGIVVELRGRESGPAELSLADEILADTLPRVREIERQGDLLVDTTKALEQKARQLDEREMALDRRQEEIAQAWDEVEASRAEVEARHTEIAQGQARLEQEQQRLNERQAALEADHSQAAEEEAQALAEREAELAARERQLEEQSAELEQRAAALAQQEAELKQQRSELEAEQAAAAAAAADTAKNAILFIGDGMGPAIVSGGRLMKGGPTARLALDAFSHTGYSRTYSTDSYVTDSAAGATALASGIKSYNGSIGVSDAKVDPSGESRAVQKLTDVAVAAGKSVGIITTTRVTHATPACFYASVLSRGEEIAIAEQVTTSSLSLLMGGGRSNFFPTNWIDVETSETGLRQDGRNLVAELQEQGWTYVESASQLEAIDPSEPDQRVLALFDYDHMEYELEREQDRLGEPSLAEMVAFAIEFLERDPDGYFLMVEAGRIDHAAHANQARRALGDFVALDEALSTALARAAEDTLIVVTADHDTGGLALNGYGPHEAVAGTGILGNAYPNSEHPRGFLSWGTGPGGDAPARVPADAPNFQHRAAYRESGASHSGVDVPVAAHGPGAARFTGYMENYLIPWKIAESLGLTFTEPANIENRRAWEARVGQGS